MKKYVVTLTEEERAGLEQLIRSGQGAARKLARARIVAEHGRVRTERAGEAGLGRTGQRRGGAERTCDRMEIGSKQPVQGYRVAVSNRRRADQTPPTLPENNAKVRH